MKNDLNNISWQEFVIEDLFKIESGKRLTRALMRKGKYPFVGATDSNNGITAYISNLNTSIDKNILGVNYNGSIVENFYHPYECLFSDDVKRFSLKNTKGNKYVYLFIKPMILAQKNKYTYGYKFNESRMRKQKILLPSTPEGKPDYAFMEAYMREKERTFLKTYKNIKQKIINLQEYNDVLPLSEKTWDTFKIGELFELKQGKSKGLNHLSKSKTGINYLGATRQNNGVLCQVKQVNGLVQKGNCIAFIRNGEGAMGYSIYKAENFIATSDISVGYNQHLNKYNGIFISTVADSARGKYNFGYKRSGKRLANEKILLPINSNGQPDYEYMENYMRKKEHEKIKAFLDMKGI